MIQIGGVYTTFCQEEGILLQKYRDRNGRCIAILFKSVGVRGRFDSPEFCSAPERDSKKKGGSVREPSGDLRESSDPRESADRFARTGPSKSGISGLRLFCLRLEASCLQLSFFAYSLCCGSFLLTVIFEIITFLIQKHFKTVTVTVILRKLI